MEIATNGVSVPFSPKAEVVSSNLAGSAIKINAIGAPMLSDVRSRKQIGSNETTISANYLTFAIRDGTAACRAFATRLS